MIVAILVLVFLVASGPGLAAASCAAHTAAPACYTASSQCMWDSGSRECYALPALCVDRLTESTCQRPGTTQCVWSGTSCQDATRTPAFDYCSAIEAPAACRNDTMCEFDKKRLACIEERLLSCRTVFSLSDCVQTHACVWDSGNNRCVELSRDYAVVCRLRPSVQTCVLAPKRCNFTSGECIPVPELASQDYAMVQTCRFNPENPFAYDDARVTAEECAARGECEINTSETAPFSCMPLRQGVCRFQFTEKACIDYSPCKWNAPQDTCDYLLVDTRPARHRSTVAWIVTAGSMFAVAFLMIGIFLYTHKYQKKWYN